ncbi:MAG: DUF5103 domain-containing protein [Bacteroidota bacterium]|nr:DUF5103 domain-containing protein [Bacteroidota bacterium]
MRSSYYILGPILWALCWLPSLHSQDSWERLRPIDTIYQEKVKTVYFSRTGNQTYYPIFYLNKLIETQLHFDLLEGSPRQLYYTFLHYNKAWTQEELEFSEYLDGFQERDIHYFKTSEHTLIPYTHYRIDLDINELHFKVSGNYLLVVYDRENKLQLSRRIYVTANDPQVKVNFISPIQASYVRSHHCMEISIIPNTIQIQNPNLEIQTVVMQNGNSQDKIELNTPNFSTANLIKYNKSDEILFPAKKEFRHKDIRSILYRTQDIDYWDERDGNYHGWLELDELRTYKPYFTDLDINGQFVIENKDVPDDDIRSEYIRAHFTLKASSPFDKDVYVIGSLSDWDLKSEYQMEYDPSRQAYFGDFLLKNGYYNFMYALEGIGGKAETSELEGDWYETENDYLILIYYRPFGGRYDQLIFAGIFNSNI